MPYTISICMIVKNEESLLDRCLGSAKGCADQIVVIDTGSTDATVAIAQKHGALVVHDAWRNDFAWSRNVSIQHATSDWILWLDADDVVPAASIPKIAALTARKPDCVLSFTVVNERPGATGSSFLQARAFPRRKDIFFERRIHEQVSLSALRAGLKIVTMPEIIIEHHGYSDAATNKKKAQRNIELLLMEFKEDDPDPVMMVEIGDSYAMLGEWDNASIWYRRIVDSKDIDKTFAIIASQAALGLGTAANEAGNHADAAQWYSRALTHAPDRADALYGLAVACDLNNKKDEAVTHLLKIISLKEKTFEVSVDLREARIKAYLRLERICRELQRHNELMPLATQALTDLSHRPEILCMAGRILMRAGKPVDALRLFEKSLEITGPENIEAYAGLSYVYVKAGRPELAQQTLDNVKTLFGSSLKYKAVRQLILGENGGQHFVNTGSEKDYTMQLNYLKMLLGC